MSVEEPATSLEALYDLMPQAEEIDLREELAIEEQRLHWIGELRPLLGAPDPDVADEPDDRVDDQEEQAHEQSEPWRLTEGQVLGMIEHVLGAERLDDDGADWDH